MTDYSMGGSSRGAVGWLLVALAVLLAVLGLVLVAGGIWLITLGGSWYYAIAGVGLLITAYCLGRGLIQAVLVYSLVWIGTVIWTIWEVGFDWWAWAPRVVAPIVILIVLLLCIPALSLRKRS
ncbi:quinoprotein glucose dehydrogenase [Tranquillimonas rosea]|uniref:Quinoprotein glucose dehydrogenase n=1 Tax=Tranquillimonas rosea TaxID=641238 RepID=A0A1H9WTA8_9RHOB|nr:glucose dehydrogenase [Tranquillimonas rosea]SES37064.1 quinoprotein glucose dehydrogenase [Tranquillimonas rosea]